MYADRSITHNSQTDALIEATPPAGTRRAEHSALRKQAEAEIAWILQIEADSMEEQSSHLPIEKRKRIARAMAHADITDQTLLRYVPVRMVTFQRMVQNQRHFARNGNPRRRIGFPMRNRRRSRPHVGLRHSRRAESCLQTNKAIRQSCKCCKCQKDSTRPETRTTQPSTTSNAHRHRGPGYPHKDCP